MKTTVKWLRDYVSIDLSPEELARRLTLAGTEVKEFQATGGDWANVLVGQVLEVKPHPNADRLTLVTVDLGTERQTVVCGAPNCRQANRIAFARAGAQLIDPHTGQTVRLKPAKIRGVVSSGMVCSEKELGISEDHQGIMVLPPDAPVGMPLADYLGDVVLDMEVTPNRPDLLSVIGLAREVAALTGKSAAEPDITYGEKGPPIEQQVAVEITAPDLCPRYCATLITGVRIAESPDWLKRRLTACGQRPISNIVDITNYVMLEYGQPLHAFDYHQVRGRKIIVRRAASGEVLLTLDGTERSLWSDMLVIADTAAAVALAGIMGGSSSEVTDRTTAILLEAASFNPASIHRTGSALGLSTEARARFERGIRADLTVPAIRRATQLMLRIGGGEAATGMIDVYPGRTEPEPVFLPVSELKRVLGIGFTPEEITGTLTSLGFGCTARDAGFRVTVPYWRSDIRLAVDLVEEVARITGYDRIPMTMLGQPIPRHDPSPMLSLKGEVRESLAGLGFCEAVSYSMAGTEALSRSGGPAAEAGLLPLVNPMTAEQAYLRPDLRVTLLPVLASNLRHEEGGIRLFEQGRVFLARPGDLPEEREMVCGVMSGPRSEPTVWGNGSSMDFFDAKGIVEALLGRLGISAVFEKSQDSGLHPEKQATVVAGGARLGTVGELHPRVQAAFELQEAACLFELDLGALLALVARHRPFQPVPRFPPVTRDLALVVDEGVTHDQVRVAIASFSLASEVRIFDVYRGEPVPRGKKSLAYRITYQSPERTLTDDEVNQVQQQVLQRLSEQLGATLRA